MALNNFPPSTLHPQKRSHTFSKAAIVEVWVILPVAELGLGFSFVSLKLRTPLASNDLRSGSGTSLQLAEDLSTMESLEVSLWFTAHLPAVQTMGNLSFYYILPDLGFLGEFFLFQNVPGYLVWGKLLSFCCFVQPLETSPCCESLEGSPGRKSLSHARSPAFSTSLPCIPSLLSLCHPLPHMCCELKMAQEGFSILTLNIGGMCRLILWLRFLEVPNLHISLCYHCNLIKLWDAFSLFFLLLPGIIDESNRGIFCF